MPLDVALLVLRVATAIALYAFLAALLWALTRDVSTASEQVRQSQRAAGAVVILECEDVPLDVGARFPVNSFTTLGRAPTCSIVIPDSFASNDHAHIVERGGQWWLEDMGSRNGTILNDVPVSDPMALATGDVIGIGRVNSE